MSDSIKVAGRRKAGEQLPLVFNHQSASGRDDLAITDKLTAAVAIVDAWPNWPAPVVILTGPQGSGKSHLAEIWRQQSAARDIVPASGSDASVVAAQGPVLFEDADRAGFDEVELFHVINSVKQNGQSLLMTSRTWPLSWNVQLPDLRSRLKAATLVEIGEPDEILLSQVIVKLFADRQLAIDERLVDYIVQRMERSLAVAQEVVERMDQLALARRSKMSRVLAAEVLDEMASATGR